LPHDDCHKTHLQNPRPITTKEVAGQRVIRPVPKWPHALYKTATLTHSLHEAVLLEKLTGSQLVQKFPGFYGI